MKEIQFSTIVIIHSTSLWGNAVKLAQTKTALRHLVLEWKKSGAEILGHTHNTDDKFIFHQQRYLVRTIKNHVENLILWMESSSIHNNKPEMGVLLGGLPIAGHSKWSKNTWNSY